MLAKAESGKAPYRFSVPHAVDKCSFMETLPHIEGRWDTPTIVLEPWQCFRDCAIFGFRRKSDGGRVVETVYEEIPRKSGKAVDIDTLIPTPDGFVRMVDIKVGDQVFAPDGSPNNVVWTGPVEIGRPCYEVEFSTGEVIIADEQHEWLTTVKVDTIGSKETKAKRRLKRFREPRLYQQKSGNHRYWYAGLYAKSICLGRVGVDDEAIRHRFDDLAAADLAQFPMGQDALTRIRTTKEIAGSVIYGKRGDFNHRVEIAGAVECPERQYTVSPYVLGAWLGDGNSNSGQITAAEDEVRGAITACGETVEPSNQRHCPYLYLVGRGTPERGGPAGSLHGRLRRLGVLNNKHVPQEYLRGSITQRWALLQGLMDTDGTVSKGASPGQSMCEFTTTKAALRDGMRELVASLGIKPTVVEGRATLYGKDCGPKWTVRFKAFADQPVFQIARKQDRLPPRPAKKTRSAGRTIVAVRPVRSRPVRCIEVEHPSHLYLVGKGFIPTHNSLNLAGTGIFCTTCEDEERPLTYIAAATQAQADKILDPMKQILEVEPDLALQFGLEATKFKIECATSRGVIQTIAAVGDHNDGHNPHCIILEELHAQKPDVYEVLRSAIDARRNPLLYQIGTAGRHASGLAWEQRTAAIRVLEGQQDADDVFVLIYTIDEEDKENVWDEEVWKKANPNWGVSIFPDKVQKFAREAKDSPMRRGEFFRTRLNIWSNAGHRLIEPDAWEACRKKGLRLADMRGKKAWIGVDLAKYLDMAAVGILIDLGPVIAGFSSFYIPEASPYLKRPDLYGMYGAWIDEGYLTTTPGGVIDVPTIRDDIVKLCDFLDVQAVGADPWQSNQLAAELESGNIPVTVYRNNTAHMSDPTYEFLARVETKTFVHNGHPVLTWNAMNVEGDERNDTIFPRKPAANADEKIDGIVSLIMANGCRLNAKAEAALKENPYETKTFLRERYD